MASICNCCDCITDQQDRNKVIALNSYLRNGSLEAQPGGSIRTRDLETSHDINDAWARSRSLRCKCDLEFVLIISGVGS